MSKIKGKMYDSFLIDEVKGYRSIKGSLVEKELLTLPEHLSSPPVFSEVRVTRSSVLCVCFVDRCLSFCTFSFGHCVVCFSSIYGSSVYIIMSFDFPFVRLFGVR
jgi:hypothetical protein